MKSAIIVELGDVEGAEDLDSIKNVYNKVHMPFINHVKKFFPDNIEKDCAYQDNLELPESGFRLDQIDTSTFLVSWIDSTEKGSH